MGMQVVIEPAVDLCGCARFEAFGEHWERHVEVEVVVGYGERAMEVQQACCAEGEIQGVAAPLVGFVRYRVAELLEQLAELVIRPSLRLSLCAVVLSYDLHIIDIVAHA